VRRRRRGCREFALGAARMHLLILAFGLSGCGYFRNRLRDAGDIVDVKGGGSMGLLVKVEASSYAGVGLGFGYAVFAEKYGRSWKASDGASLGVLSAHVLRRTGGSRRAIETLLRTAAGGGDALPLHGRHVAEGWLSLECPQRGHEPATQT
jgi:hypothetical protein